MQVRLAGFQLKLHPKLTFDALFAEMVKKAAAGRFKFQSHHRVLFTQADGGYYLGSLLTDRGHKNFLAINTQTNALARGTLGPHKNFGAFNFFVLCPAKSSALITCYRDAGGPSFVFGVLAALGEEILARLLQSELTKLGPKAIQKEREKLITAHTGPSLDWTEILGKEQFDAILRRWKKIRSIEVAYATKKQPAAFVPEGVDDDPVGHTYVRYAFKRGTIVGRAVEYIKSLWKSDETDESEAIRVDGVDEWGVARRVELADKIPSLFGELDHDAIIRRRH